MPDGAAGTSFVAMRIGREVELQCPRCRVIAVRGPGRQDHCTHCGAELVVTQNPSEDWVRAYLYGDNREVNDALAGPARTAA